MKVIINADDFGIDDIVNQRIISNLEKGTISSTSILANGPAFLEAIHYARNHCAVSYGIHLNIVEFDPITDNTVFKRNGIVDNDGHFIEGAIFTISHFSDELKNAIFIEWDAQIELVKKFGIIPSHIDSHQHTHTIPALQSIVFMLMKKHNLLRIRRAWVPSIRLMIHAKPEEAVIFSEDKSSKESKHNVLYRRLYLLYVIYQTNNWNRKMRSHFILTDGFYAYRTLFWNYDLLKRKLSNSCLELMVHPGHESYEKESLLMEKNALAEKTSFQIVSYKDI